MLSLFLFGTVTVLSFFLFGIRRDKRYASLAIVFLNIFILEFLVYVFFLFQIHQGNSFFLIGQQKGLDYFIHHKLEKDIDQYHGSHNHFYIIDDDLGYTLAKNQSYMRYKTNAAGMRSDHEYEVTPDKYKLRMVTLGDSFVFGDGEPNAHVWTNILENSITNLEVLNFGVSGYGLSQAVKRYFKEGILYRPDIVFLNYLTMGNRDRVDAKSIIEGSNLKMSTFYRVHYSVENDRLVSKVVTPFKLFDAEFREKNIYAPLGLSENRGFWSVGFLKFLNTSLFVRQLYFRKSFSSAPAEDFSDVKTNVYLLAELIKNIRENKSFLIIFGEGDLRGFPAPIQAVLENNRDCVAYLNGRKMLEGVFQAKGLERKSLLNQTDHYNAKGNGLYAQVIAGILASREWGEGERKFKFDAVSKGFISRNLP